MSLSVSDLETSPKTSSWTAAVQSSNLFSIFKKSVVWLSKPANFGVAFNLTIAGLTAFQLIQQGFIPEVYYDFLTHSVSAITFLTPTKEGTAIGVMLNTARGVWILHSGITGDFTVPLKANLIDFGAHQINNFIYLTQPDSPSIFARTEKEKKASKEI